MIHSGNTLRTDQVFIITPAPAIEPFLRILETAEAPKMTVIGNSIETSPRLLCSWFTSSLHLFGCMVVHRLQGDDVAHSEVVEETRHSHF